MKIQTELWSHCAAVKWQFLFFPDTSQLRLADSPTSLKGTVRWNRYGTRFPSHMPFSHSNQTWSGKKISLHAATVVQTVKSNFFFSSQNGNTDKLLWTILSSLKPLRRLSALSLRLWRALQRPTSGSEQTCGQPAARSAVAAVRAKHTRQRSQPQGGCRHLGHVSGAGELSL